MTASGSRVTIVDAVAPPDVDAVRELIREYQASLGLDLELPAFRR